MGALHRRLAALEAEPTVGFVPWVQIVQTIGQTEEEAISGFETANGPVDDKNKLLWVVVRKPGRACG